MAMPISSTASAPTPTGSVGKDESGAGGADLDVLERVELGVAVLGEAVVDLVRPGSGGREADDSAVDAWLPGRLGGEAAGDRARLEVADRDRGLNAGEGRLPVLEHRDVDRPVLARLETARRQGAEPHGRPAAGARRGHEGGDKPHREYENELLHRDPPVAHGSTWAGAIVTALNVWTLAQCGTNPS